MLELNFDPFPILTTERLILRRISLDDAEDLFVLRKNEDAMRYINKPLPKTVDEVIELINRMNEITERIQWAITLKTDKSFISAQTSLIGTIGYHRIEKEHYRAEVGYMIQPALWNKGITSEALAKVLDFGFNEMNLHSIEANINPSNEVSRKLLKKLNFIKEGYFKEDFFFDGKFWDSEIYSLLKKRN